MLGRGKADALVGVVEVAVVLAHEDVTEDGRDGLAGGSVHLLDAEEALRGGAVHGGASGDLEHVVFGLEHVFVASNVDGDVGQAADVGAVAAHGEAGGVADEISGANEQRSATVDDAVLVHFVHLVADLDASAAEGPPSLQDDWVVGEGAGEVLGVNTFQDEQTVSAGVAQVEGEGVVLHKAILDSCLVPGDQVVHRDGLEGESSNTGHLASQERHTAGGGHLTEGVVGHGHTSHGHGVNALEARDATRAILDLERGAVLLVGGALAGVVSGVGPAGWGPAGVGVHPHIGGAGVGDHLEVLRGRSEAHGDAVLGIHVVVNLDFLAAIESVMDLLGGLGARIVVSLVETVLQSQWHVAHFDVLCSHGGPKEAQDEQNCLHSLAFL